MATWTIPPIPLDCIQPVNDEINESDKFKDKGAWFAQYARYIVGEFYNPLRRQFLPGLDKSDIRIHDRRLENFAYYFGVQGLKSLAYTIPTVTNRSVSAVFIPDQKIRSLVDYMKGNIIDMIQPLKDSISATGLSEHIQSDRDELWRELKTQYFLQNQGLDQLGISYKAMPDKQFDSLQDIDDFMAQWQHEYEKAAVAITENIYYDQNLATEFEDDAVQTFIGSLCSTLVEVNNGKVENIQIPCYNAIYDYRSRDQFGKGAMVCGGVFNGTPSELFAKFPELTEAERLEIIEMSKDNEASRAFTVYYNNDLNNITWWNRQSGTVTYAIVYWIGRKDLKYKKSITAFGGVKIVEETDNGLIYATNGNKAKSKDGVAGNEWAWMVHKAVLIGNKYCVDYGYPDYQIRTGGPKTKPMLPILQLCHASYNGYARSIVDRLRQHADERGRLAMKIQELTANDIGKVFFVRGSVVNGIDSAREILEDFKSMKIHVLDDSSGETNDPSADKRIIEMVDMTLDPNIMNYVRLSDEQARLMEEIVSVPAVALGTQTDVFGKAVQQRTIAQATLGQKSLYTAIAEHWRRKLQYNFNVAKLLYTEEPETVKLLPINEKQTYLLKITKKFRAEDIGIYILPNDPIEAKDMGIFEQAILGFMQNINAPGALEGLETSLKLMKAKTFSQGLADIEKRIRLNKKEAQRAAQMQQQVDIAGQQAAAQAQQQAIVLQQQGDFIREMKKLNTGKAWDYEMVLAKLGNTIDQKIAEAFIKNSQMEISHQQQMEQSQQQQQHQIEQSNTEHQQQMEQNDMQMQQPSE